MITNYTDSATNVEKTITVDDLRRLAEVLNSEPPPPPRIVRHSEVPEGMVFPVILPTGEEVFAVNPKTLDIVNGVKS